MDSQKVLSVVKVYEDRLLEECVPKKRMDTSRTFASLSKEEVLAHAHFLIDGVKEYAVIEGKEGKTGRHLASIQVCLSFAGWYTLLELMNHNKP